MHVLGISFDYHLLRHIIDEFGSKDLKKHMSQYEHDLKVFKSRTSIVDLLECWPAGQDMMPKNYSEVMGKIDEDPKHYTVAELDAI